MKCVICRHGETHLGTTTVTLERDNVTLVFKSVPARVCDNCGEDYVDEDTAAQLLALLDEAERAGVVLDVRDLAAAAPTGP
jgi:YgiT-type zinc finger domain-containing protein